MKENGPEIIKKAKFLFIDDSSTFIDSWSFMFGDYDAAFVKCKTVKEAVEAIEKYSPEAIFLDHNLTETNNSMGEEGFEIAKKAIEINKDIKLYSTSSSGSRIVKEYQERGIPIEYAGKGDMKKYKEIMEK